jgi:hypothetical protein
MEVTWTLDQTTISRSLTIDHDPKAQSSDDPVGTPLATRSVNRLFPINPDLRFRQPLPLRQGSAEWDRGLPQLVMRRKPG